MKVLLLSLLLLLCISQVFSLRCYTCEDGDDNICKSETDCPSSAHYCKTVERAGEITSRSCEQFCAEDFFTTCCETDLC